MSNDHQHNHHIRQLGHPDGPRRSERVLIREATAADDEALGRLAGRDSARVPASPLLLAEVAGEVVAAVSMLEASAIADPFRPTAEIVEILRVRAGHSREALRGAGRIRRLGRSPFGVSPRPAQPRPSSPSAPGLPAIPGS